jgi:hypothetical protein
MTDDITRRVAEIRQTVYTDWRTVIEDVAWLCDTVTELQRRCEQYEGTCEQLKRCWHDASDGVLDLRQRIAELEEVLSVFAL